MHQGGWELRRLILCTGSEVGKADSSTEGADTTFNLRHETRLLVCGGRIWRTYTKYVCYFYRIGSVSPRGGVVNL